MENDYSDLYGNPTELTKEELQYFADTVQRVQCILGTNIQIVNRDHEKLNRKDRNALGQFCTTDPKNPEKDCLITIDNYFIHECFEEKYHGEFNLNFCTLEDVICHELAHAKQFRHCKRHQRITEEYVKRVNEARQDAHTSV